MTMITVDSLLTNAAPQTPLQREGLKKPHRPSPKEKSRRIGYETAIYLFANLKAIPARTGKNQTEAEKILWQQLRNYQTGYNRRQHAYDGYIAVCVLPKGLVIEIDGGYHETTKRTRRVRTAILNNEGFKVISFHK